jgi:phospholipase/carboxylesterase
VNLVAPDSRGPTWDLIDDRRFGPDVAFLDKVLDAVVDRLDADTERMAIGGVSDGASYALSIGLTNGDVFPTLVAFSPGFLVAPYPTGAPRVFISHGRADPVLPIDGCSRSFVPSLRAAGYEVNFRETAATPCRRRFPTRRSGGGSTGHRHDRDPAHSAALAIR